MRIFSLDSKPIATDDLHPKGTIYFYNKYLNGKLRIKIHTLSIVYPFILPISFDFTPANYHDSPILRKLIPTIAPIFTDLNTPIYLTADNRNGYDKHQNRINYRCYDKECSQSCSHRVWLPLESRKYRKIPSEYFFSMRSYIEISVSDFSTQYNS